MNTNTTRTHCIVVGSATCVFSGPNNQSVYYQSLRRIHGEAERGVLDDSPCVVHLRTSKYHGRVIAPLAFSTISADRVHDIVADLTALLDELDASAAVCRALVAFCNTWEWLCGEGEHPAFILNTPMLFHICDQLAVIVERHADANAALPWRVTSASIASVIKRKSLEKRGLDDYVTSEVLLDFVRRCVVPRGAPHFSPDDPYVQFAADLGLLLTGPEAEEWMRLLSLPLAFAVARYLRTISHVANPFLDKGFNSTLLSVAPAPLRPIKASASSSSLSSSGTDVTASTAHTPLRTADFRITIEGTDVDYYVHEWLVAAQWPYLRRLRDANLSEAQNRHLSLTHDRFPSFVMEALIKSAYGLGIPMVHTCSVQSQVPDSLADEFELSPLVKLDCRPTTTTHESTTRIIVDSATNPGTVHTFWRD